MTSKVPKGTIQILFLEVPLNKFSITIIRMYIESSPGFAFTYKAIEDNLENDGYFFLKEDNSSRS